MLENPFSHSESHKSVEVLKTESLERLNNILYKPLTVENIESFADTALEETIRLVQELLYEYQNNQNIDGDLSLNTQQQEDAICEKLGLPNIPQLLDRIQEVKNNIDNIKSYLEGSVESSGDVITPPDQLEHEGIIPGEKAFEKKKLIPRLLTLMYILNIDFGLDVKDKANVQIIEGEVTDTMMRKTPYARVLIPDLNRAVYVCDEEGNASYVFDTKKLEELNIPLDDLDIDGKKDKNSLIVMYPRTGVRVVQTPNWRVKMKTYLEEELPEQQISVEADDENIGNEIHTSEFEKKEYLTFEEFKDSVRSQYPGKGDVQRWYHVERKNHTNWPSAPQKVYRDYWNSWPDLVGKLNPLEKPFLDFEDFKNEVLALYPGEGSIRDWYRQEKKNHLGWPSEPEVEYKDAGWTGWSGIFGFEDNTKKTFLGFADFSEEIKKLYPGEGSVENWYQEERKNHKNWPALPKLTYKEKGWAGWYRIIGKENPLEKQFIDFSDFMTEVRAFYSDQGNIEDWYRKEKEIHSGWPSAPNVIYKDAGWVGWPELVGKENMFKKEFSDFETFSAEVRSLYTGGDVQRWYHVERKNHENWPSLPAQYYKNNGWDNWSALVGKENHKRREFISFEDFIGEVKTLYPSDKPAINEWYKKERQNHKNWPALPYKYFKSKGWTSWNDILPTSRV